MFKGKPAPGAGGSGKSLKSLCGYVANEETVTLENGKHLTVEFVQEFSDRLYTSKAGLMPSF